MGKGRKPKPTALKMLEGNPGKRDLEAELLAPSEIPAAPECLAQDAADVWSKITQELHKLGVLARVDVHTIAAYCNIVSRMQEAQALLDKEELIYESKNEKTGITMLRSHPALKIVQECEAKLMRFAVEFGMTAASRTKLKNPGQGDLFPDDPTANRY